MYNIWLITVLKNQCVIFTKDFYGVEGGADNMRLIMVLENQCGIITRDFYGVEGGADNIRLIMELKNQGVKINFVVS